MGEIGKCYEFNEISQYIKITSKLNQSYAVFFNVLELQTEYSSIFSTYSYSNERSGFRIRTLNNKLQLLLGGNKTNNAIVEINRMVSI